MNKQLVAKELLKIAKNLIANSILTEEQVKTLPSDEIHDKIDGLLSSGSVMMPGYARKVNESDLKMVYKWLGERLDEKRSEDSVGDGKDIGDIIQMIAEHGNDRD